MGSLMYPYCPIASQVERHLLVQLIAKIPPIKLSEHFLPYPVNNTVRQGPFYHPTQIQPLRQRQVEVMSK